jgi:hypothetical protein
VRDQGESESEIMGERDAEGGRGREKRSLLSFYLFLSLYPSI